MGGEVNEAQGPAAWRLGEASPLPGADPRLLPPLLSTSLPKGLRTQTETSQQQLWSCSAYARECGDWGVLGEGAREQEASDYSRVVGEGAGGSRSPGKWWIGIMRAGGDSGLSGPYSFYIFLIEVPPTPAERGGRGRDRRGGQRALAKPTRLLSRSKMV